VADEKWLSRDLLILEEVVTREGNRNVSLHDLCTVLEMDPDEVKLGIRALADGRYLTALPVEVEEEWLPADYDDIRPLERGRRAVGQWPRENTYENFLETIERAIDEESDEDKRTGLQKLRDSVVAAGRSVGSGLLLEFLKQQTGLR
jgi:hypothetical protein